MVIPSVRDVHGWRAVVRRACRAAAVLFGVWGVALIVKRLAFGAFMGSPSIAWSVYTEVGESHEMSRGIGLLCASAILAFLSDRIARWVISPVDSGCPSCGYAAEPTLSVPCPECGWKPGA